MAAKRKCAGTTKKNTPCGANPLKPGTIIKGFTVTGNWCIQHDEDLPDSARIGGAQPGAGRPRVPRITDVYADELHKRVGEHVEDLIGRLVEIAMDAERTVVVGTGPNARTEIAPDQALQLAALRELNDRILGRPKQTQEITGAGGGAQRIEVVLPQDDAWHQSVAQVLHEAGAITALAAVGHTNGNGNGNDVGPDSH